MCKLETLKNKIIYRSIYRGTKEMDILLSKFVISCINDLNKEDLKDLNTFLNFDDLDLLNLYKKDIKIDNFVNKKILSLYKSFKI
tara:strand:+ start:244 stop:498 length:255 start_codon:yes stop_codon:yes gene_type:complete